MHKETEKVLSSIALILTLRMPISGLMTCTLSCPLSIVPMFIDGFQPLLFLGQVGSLTCFGKKTFQIASQHKVESVRY